MTRSGKNKTAKKVNNADQKKDGENIKRRKAYTTAEDAERGEEERK